MTRHKFIYGILTLALLSCGSSDKKDKSSDNQAVKVETMKVNSSTQNRFSFSGTVSAKQMSTIKTRHAGYVKNILVNVGDKVKKNQILLNIDNADLQTKLQQAKAGKEQAQKQFEIAQKDLKRYERLKESNSISDKELEQIQLQYQSSLSAFEQAKQSYNQVAAMMDYTNIKAPFTGTISNKMIQEGDMAMPGMPLLSLTSLSQLEVKSNLSETQITKVKPRQKVSIQVPSVGKTFKGIITEVSSSSETNGNRYFVKTAFKNTPKEVLSGMFAKLYTDSRTQGDSKEVLVSIPQSVLVRQNGLEGVYVYGKSNTALLRWIKTGRQIGDQIEVLSGLTPQDKIIISAESRLYNGLNITE
ncbi:MAG: efflux RND transporter periplasmic adaptor subunit [Psychroflexus sp.]|nr:efflux RND transporter periplasmic adaptor subunit [Psychroflexus sp.]